MHDQRRFGYAGPGQYSPAPTSLHREPGPGHTPAPATPEAPLFLDEPEDAPRAAPEQLLAGSDLFLDESDPAVWDATPALSPSIDAYGETRFARSLYARVRTAVVEFAQPRLLKGFGVIATLVALAAVGAYLATGVSPLALWHGLGF